MRRVYSFISVMISSMMFTGFLPKKVFRKSGAGGGLISSLVVVLLIQIPLLYANVHWTVNFWFGVAFFVMGMITVGPAEDFLRKNGEKRMNHLGRHVSTDFNELNIDEAPGQFLAGLSAFLVDGSFAYKMLILLCSFVAFRAFDVYKPLGIAEIEKSFESGHPVLSVMLDDVLAGVYALCITMAFFEAC